MAVNFEFLDTFDQKQVLIVDDDDFILGVLEKLLKLLGIEQVLKAGNGGEAREVLEKHAVDLLITDVQMPELDGLSLLKLIRTGQTSAPIFLPSIVVTNLEDEDVLALALSLDVNGFVQKPFTTPMLIKRILVALSESFQEPSGYPYEGVVIESSRLQLDDGGEVSLGSEANQVIAAELGDNVTLVSLFQLKPDMQVAEDIKTQNGTLLLPRGFRLNETRIHRMWEIRDNLEKRDFKIMTSWPQN